MSEPPFFYRISTRLNLLFILLTSLPLVLVGYWSFQSGKSSIEQNIFTHLVSVNLLKTGSFENWLGNNESSLEQIASRPSLETSLQHFIQCDETELCKALSAQIVREHFEPSLVNLDGFLLLSIIDAKDGQIIISTEQDLVGKYRESETYFQEGLKGTYTQGTAYEMSHGGAVMHVATPIHAPDGSLLGVLSAHANLDQMTAIMSQRSDMSKSEDSYMVNGFNFFVTEPRFGQDFTLRKSIQTFGVKACLSGKNGIALYDDYRGEPVLGAYQWLPEQALCVITEIDQQEIYAPVINLGKRLSLITIGITFLATFLGIYFTRSISNAVETLSHGAARIGTGDLTTRVSINNQNEIGQLAISFNNMAANLMETQTQNKELLEELKSWAETLEKRVAERTEELERSNQELEQFAYVASHDLQEPLRMVVSYLQLLERRYKDRLDGDALEFIAYAVDGANRMKSLISDLLAYSRVGTRGKEFTSVNCDTMLKNILKGLEVLITENNAEIICSPLPTVTADQSQLTSLFQNLIANAIKFHGEETPKIQIAAEKRENEWLFTVKDNGIGIEPQYFERIFIIFQRLHSRTAYSGTGIGLAISKRIIERHGGKIWLKSVPGEGTTFFFTLPIGERNEIEHSTQTDCDPAC